MPVSNCTFSNPKVLDSSGQLTDPIDDTQSFQFTDLECEYELSTPSAATTSTSINYDTATLNSISDLTTLFYYFMVIVILYIGFRLGTFLFKNR